LYLIPEKNNTTHPKNITTTPIRVMGHIKASFSPVISEMDIMYIGREKRAAPITNKK